MHQGFRGSAGPHGRLGESPAGLPGEKLAPPRSREIVGALLDQDKAVSYAEIKSEQGHDSFLLGIPLYHQILQSYLDKAAPS